MRGPTAASALESRFDAIRRAEVARLGRKLAALDAAERSLVEAIVAEVVHGLAARPARVLREHDAPQLVETALRLFGVAGAE